MAKYPKFIARTVMVQEGNDIKRRSYYEKPCRRRQKESYETCQRMYNMEMAHKINFL
ncbi:unnamed protein product [Nyctereutes procyonoides]|uniref:(raccoon dog) hypothetical protein n=1 Tax=Nyctereutes procyonoides TaxID=34880 RepID=A0A811ZWA0_NYCPR|nr:unnamed protein product [Nyctereutes procyonoides]